MSEKLSERMLTHFVEQGTHAKDGTLITNYADSLAIAEIDAWWRKVATLERQLAEALAPATNEEVHAIPGVLTTARWATDFIAARRRRIMGEGE